tara:strand:+ start:14213 stop:17710 length:3498 start_codon:yes stop_codon:yes gene_type:complete
MKKINCELISGERNFWKSKFLRKMRIVAFLLLISITQTFALESYAQTKQLSLNLRNETIVNILNKIEDQSEFYFMFDATIVDVSQRKSINCVDQPITEVLEQLLKNTKIVYEISDRQIVLTSAQKTEVGQSKTISGRVTDSSGAPLPGVTVVIKGTVKGTITDVDGSYSLPSVPGDGTLVFSFVGMKTQEVAVSGQSIIDVVLAEDAIGIEEVVAIGYGTVRRKDLTGSVASVSGNILKDIPVTSAAQAIVGRIPGVQVTKTEGSPDADIKIRIRGGGSITQDNSPLYVVDGFPVDNINDIAPTDIESIDVLKDASSTAIYGARGANGVILITTKGGFDGKGKVSYNMYFGVKDITKTLDVLDPYEYVYWQYEIAPDADYFSRYFGDFGDFGLYKQMKGTDWQDEVFGKTGTSMYHNLAFSGGSKISKYNISLTRNDEKEIMMGSGYERTNLTVKTLHKINDWLTIDFNSRLSDYYLKGAGTSSNSRLAHAVQFRPVDGLIDFVDSDLDDGDFEVSSSFILNPVKQTNDDYKRYKNLTFNFNGAATIQFSKNLQYRFEYGYQYGERTNKHFYGLNTSNSLQYGEQPLASIEKTDMKSYRLANVLTYNKRDFIPGNNLTIMIGEELNYSKSESVTSSAKYFPKYIDAVSALSMMELGTTDPIETSDNPAAKIASFFGRLNYDYKGKYLASATFRADGSSKFAPGNQWGYFPSVSSAWRISDEQFMKETEQWLSNLKLRVSYGQSGNNRISDNAWRKTFSVSTGKLFIGNEDTPTAYLTPNSILSNPDLKWETTVTRNLGLDFGFFKQRLTGSLEAYKNTTKDLLISATIPSNTGYSTQWQNIGETSNKGFEIVLNGVICDQKDLKVSVSFNIGFNKNKIDKLGETKRWEQTAGWARSDGPSGDYLIEEGGKIGLMYGYETEGMYSFNDFDYNDGSYTLKEGISDNSALINAVRFLPGALKLKDQNDDMVVNTDDKVVIGDANPKHSGGFNLTAQYKMLDFSAFFNWVYGNDIYNANKLYFTSFASGRYYKNLLNIMNSENRFTYISQETGAVVSDPAELQEMNKNSTIWSPANSLVPLHSWGIEDGSFLRLNNITVGYSVPKNLLNEFRIEQLRFYFTAYNLWTWTNYSGYDPEVDTQRSTPLTPGIDWSAYPRSRSFNVGLNLTF